MLTFTYISSWKASYSGDLREEAWLKRIFTYTDLTDTRFKARTHYFPILCTLDFENKIMSHGQVLHAIRQARADGIPVAVNDPTKRCMLDTGQIPENFLPELRAYDYQLLSSQIALGAGQGIVNIATGGGKTVCLGIIVKALATMTDCPGILILIFSKDLLNQTARRLESYGVPGNDIGIIHSDIDQDKQREESKKRIVLSTHLSITKFNGVIERTRYVLCDECHRSIGPLWSALFGILPNLTNVLGFTATPWDNENERQKMIAIYGQELMRIPLSFLMQRGVVMTPEAYFIRVHYKDRDIKLAEATDWREARKQYIYDDRNRNLLPIIALRKFGGRELVLYDDLKHGEHLKELYEKEGFETRLAEGKTTTSNRESSIEWFEKDCAPGQQGKVLLASKIFDEGIDFKGGCDIFFPIGAGKDISKVTQRAGRALRKNRSGKIRFFDVQDANHSILSRWSGARRKAWEDCGIKVKQISLEDFAAM